MLKALILIVIPICFCVLMVAGFHFIAALGMGLYLGLILTIERFYKVSTGQDLEDADTLIEAIRRLFSRQKLTDRE